MKKSFIFLWVGILVLLLFFWVYFPTLSRYRDLKIEEEKIAHELAELNVKIDALTEERNLLKNDKEYLEKVIRRELGLVKPGEMVYKFVQEEEPLQKPEEKTAPEKTVAEKLPVGEAPPTQTEQSSKPSEPAYPRQETR